MGPKPYPQAMGHSLPMVGAQCGAHRPSPYWLYIPLNVLAVHPRMVRAGSLQSGEGSDMEGHSGREPSFLGGMVGKNLIFPPTESEPTTQPDFPHMMQASVDL